MNEGTSGFVEVTADYCSVHVASRPVTMTDFLAFLEDVGRPVPAGVRRAPANVRGGGDGPVIGVTQVDAATYCEWLGKRMHHALRLPSTNELDALMPHTTVSQSHGPVPDASFWSHEEGQLTEVRGGLKPVFLCEWTRDIDDTASDLGPERTMALIFYPPWLREGDNPLHAHAALLASGSYSFVTFRVSYEG